MSYTAEISRKNPGCLLFLIDQSGSMSDGWSGEKNRNKADELATMINRLLQTLVINCSRDDGIRDYYHVGVIGYGATVGFAFGGTLAGKELLPLSLIADNPTRIEERKKKVDDGAGGLVNQTIKLPIWFDPIANGGTPMCQALAQAHALVQSWVSVHPVCFPPIVINITDGEATDGDPTLAAEKLKVVSSSDGNVLLFNAHISSKKAEKEILYPDNENDLPDEFARMLFHMSSTFPTRMQDKAKAAGYKISEANRGFVFNAQIASLIEFLKIGSDPANR